MVVDNPCTVERQTPNGPALCNATVQDGIRVRCAFWQDLAEYLESQRVGSSAKPTLMIGSGGFLGVQLAQLMGNPNHGNKNPKKLGYNPYTYVMVM